MIIKNNSMQEITINSSFGSFAIPMAVEGKDSEGKFTIIQGSLDVPENALEEVSESPVVVFWFDSKTLEAVANEPEIVVEDKKAK